MRRRRTPVPPQEAPAWYRSFDPAAWDEPDAHELSMTGGRDVRDWPGHVMHARRRWAEAQIAYRRSHPLLATQEFNEILARRAVRRAQP